MDSGSLTKESMNLYANMGWNLGCVLTLLLLNHPTNPSMLEPLLQTERVTADSDDNCNL